jgi:thymidylate kinase
VLDVDVATLVRRLDQRSSDDFGGTPEERDLILRLHATKEDTPRGVLIDAARPLDEVVDTILAIARA